MDSLWREFQSDNLRVRLERSFVTTDSSQALPPPLDLWGWNMIGLVRSKPLIPSSYTEQSACISHHNKHHACASVPSSYCPFFRASGV
jgi:hypothetical protein